MKRDEVNLISVIYKLHEICENKKKMTLKLEEINNDIYEKSVDLLHGYMNFKSGIIQYQRGRK